MLPYMVIALNFALQRWDGSIPHRYIGHTFAIEDCRLFCIFQSLLIGQKLERAQTTSQI